MMASELFFSLHLRQKSCSNAVYSHFELFELSKLCSVSPPGNCSASLILTSDWFRRLSSGFRIACVFGRSMKGSSGVADESLEGSRHI